MAYNACYMCDNAKTNPELNKDNDYACFTIGSMPKYSRLMLCTGYGKPLRIEFEEWNDIYCRWETNGVYYPKHCPNCGREITEYKKVE